MHAYIIIINHITHVYLLINLIYKYYHVSIINIISSLSMRRLALLTKSSNKIFYFVFFVQVLTQILSSHHLHF